MNWTQEQLDAHYSRVGIKPSERVVNAGAQPRTARKPKREVYEGPVDVTLTLHGTCPTKKNEWQRGGSGKMFIPTEVKKQITALTLQAMFQWPHPAPVENPDVTVTFYVSARRQDQDGMWTTILDCLQDAGILLNDNIKSNNGRKVLEPCQFVDESQQRVQIRLRKDTDLNA